MKKPKVKLSNVSKSYSMISKRSDKFLELLSFKKKKDQKEFFALSDISFEVFEGDTVGIIGLNGSGKSTLSNIIAEIIQPSSGDIEINGDTSLIAISAGLNNNLTGKENIKLKCMMHGLTEEQIDKIEADIIEFADVGNYINQPVKYYSSGMKSKLGFAISVHIDPDILIIDEALSVGDTTFTEKSLKKMYEFKERGRTIFFISHSASQVRSFCDKAIWMHFGELVEFGDVKEITEKYKEYTQWFNKLSEVEKKKYRQDKLKSQIKLTTSNANADKNRNFINIISSIFLLIPTVVLGILVFLGY